MIVLPTSAAPTRLSEFRTHIEKYVMVPDCFEKQTQLVIFDCKFKFENLPIAEPASGPKLRLIMK